MKATLSVILATIFIASSVYLIIGTHFCGGHAVKSSLMVGHTSLTCGMSKDDVTCEEKPAGYGNILVEKECCQDMFKAVQIEDDYQKRLTSQKLTNKSFTLHSFKVFNLDSKIEFNSFLGSKRAPPLIQESKNVLFQTFLI